MKSSKNTNLSEVCPIPNHESLINISDKNKVLEKCELVLAAGHHDRFTLSVDGKTLFKNSSVNEIEFYKLNAVSSSPFMNIIPKLFSINQEKSLIELENLTYGMKEPTVVDIKIGTHTFDVSRLKNADKETLEKILSKKEKNEYKDITSGARERGWKIQGGSWLKEQDRLGINSEVNLNYFIKMISSQQILAIIEQLNKVANVISNNKYGFARSSILIAVDGTSIVRVKLIDFANAFVIETDTHIHYKTGPLKGISALVNLLSKCV